MLDAGGGTGCGGLRMDEDAQGNDDGTAEKSRTAGRGDRAGLPRGGARARRVELMAVSKTYPAETIAEAAGLGLRLFGENRVQEFAAKAAGVGRVRVRGSNAAADAPVLVHLIGHLQSNKAARAVELFDAIDSVDSLKLAERLNEAAGKLGKRLPVLIEVKLSPEETKAGLEPESQRRRDCWSGCRIWRFGDAGADDDCAVGRGKDVTRACFRSLRVAGPVGGGASAIEARCVVDGDERGFCAGD
jgi:hypothetical protein